MEAKRSDIGINTRNLLYDLVMYTEHMTTDTFDYSAFVDSAMRGVVRDILRQVTATGLPGSHHFFISFRTDFKGVEMSEGLRHKYPREITIVLQHQYWDLLVTESQFKVALSFNNIPEKLTVPFAALTGFADPSTKFGLQFHSEPEEEGDVTQPAAGMVQASSAASVPAVAVGETPKEGGAQIIALDAFRKK